MAMHVEVKNALAVVAVGAIVYQVMKSLRNAIWEPLRLHRIMEKQGLRGPPFHFLVGSLEANAFSESCPEALPLDNYANLSLTVTPHYALYFPKYGPICELLIISGGQSYVTFIHLKKVLSMSLKLCRMSSVRSVAAYEVYIALTGLECNVHR